MKKSNQVIIVLCFLVSHIVVGGYFVYLINEDTYQIKKVAYEGEVTNYISEDYLCGKHGRSTCTKYVIYLDNKPFNATKEEFDYVVLGIDFIKYEIVQDIPWYAKYFASLAIVSLILLVFSPALVPFGILDD